MSRRSARIVPFLVGLSLAACGGSPSSAESHPAAAPTTPPATPSASSQHQGGTATRFADWPTYHRTPNRSGRAVGQVGHLSRAWIQHLSGAVYGEPLLVGGRLIVATEADDVYALDPRTGHVQWRRHLGTPARLSSLPCGDIDPLGITGTPAYDAATGSVFAVAETTGGHHTLWALDAANGRRRWHRSLDTQPDRSRIAEQERSALLVTHGRVITAFGGLAGDCANYVGYVTSVATDGRGTIHSYAVPTTREAGIWAPPGVVRGRNGTVYVPVGNGEQVSGHWDRSDSVTELSPVHLRRLSAFAPATWQADNAADLDLGSSAPIPVGRRIVIAGKRGTVYLLRPTLGGIGSSVRHIGGCVAFGGGAVVDAHTVLMPCLGEYRIRELHVGRHHLGWGWSAPGVYSSPVVAGSRAYVADRNTGDLVVLRLADGHRLQHVHAGTLTHFPSVAISSGMVFVPTLTGVTAFRGK